MPLGTTDTSTGFATRSNPSGADAAVGRRELNKARTRVAIEQAGWQLLSERGFSDVTITEIAEMADVAPRTYFRYFDSKEAVLFGDWRSDLTVWTDLVAARPSDEVALTALAGATLEFTERCAGDREQIVRRYLVPGAASHLVAYHAAVIQPEWDRCLTHALARRMDKDPLLNTGPRFYAGIGIAALNAATSVWLAGDCEGSLPALTTASFEDLAVLAPRRAP